MAPTEKAVAGASISSNHNKRDVMKLYEAIRLGKAKIAGADGHVKNLPRSLDSFLIELTVLLNNGRCAYIVRNQSTLTTVEAATILGTSRQFLVNLLDRGDIPHHMIGTEDLHPGFGALPGQERWTAQIDIEEPS